MNDIREELAAYSHDKAWSGWIHYWLGLSIRNADGSVTTPAMHVARWERQMSTPYAQLPEHEKTSDREEADKMLAIIGVYDGE